MTSVLQWHLLQYVPDLARRETRNVGLVAVCDGRAAARFLGVGAEGKVQAEALPAWIADATSYQTWVDHWSEVVGEERLRLTQALTPSQSKRYVSVWGTERIDGEDLDAWVEGRFRDVVLPAEEQTPVPLPEHLASMDATERVEHEQASLQIFVADLLALLSDELGVTRDALAARVGISRKRLDVMLSGSDDLRLSELAHIALSLGVRVDMFLISTARKGTPAEHDAPLPSWVSPIR